MREEWCGMEFSRESALASRIVELMRERGWSGLTETQEAALTYITTGYNVLVVAPTGAGKTEAALLPILSMMLRESPEPVALLYITPMKALINDLYHRIKWWADRLGFRVARKHGDTPSRERSARLRRRPHILITTPESLEVDLDWSSSFRRYLANVRYVVVDEVHELVGSKRGGQLLVLLERLKRLAGRDFQRVGLSATVQDPASVLDALSGSSSRPKRVVGAGGVKDMQLRVLYIDDEKSRDVWKDSALLLSRDIEPPSLVFTNSRFMAEKLKEAMEDVGIHDVFVHHSSVSAEVREEAEERLRRGEIRAIVCTKTLEVGIDVGRIRRVIQYRAPGSVASLIQRVGRSGHALHQTPRGSIITVGWLDFAEALAEAGLARLGFIEDRARGRLVTLDVAAKEIVGMALQGGITPEEAVETILSAAPDTGLSRRELERLLGYLIRRRLVRVERGTLKPGPTFYKIWRFQGGDPRAWWSRSFSEFFSTINEREVFTVWHGDKQVGSVDSLFVYRYLRIGDAIRLAGRTWRVKSIDPAQGRVLVEPSSEAAETPLWRGEGPRRSPAVAEEVGRIIESPVDAEVEADEAGLEMVRARAEEYRRRGIPVPGRRRIVYENYLNEHIFTVMLGTGANEALALAISHLASRDAGLNIYYRASFYGFSVHAPGVDVLGLLKSLEPSMLPEVVEAALERSPYLAQAVRAIQLDFGKTDRVDPVEDEIIVREAKRQVIETYLDLEEAMEFLRDLRAGRVEVYTAGAGGLTPLSRELLSVPATRPWIHDLADRIAGLIHLNPLTPTEIADLLDLSQRTIEAKLKEMRRPGYGPLRTAYFIDIDEGEARWTLVSDFPEVAESEEFSASFEAPDPEAPLKVIYSVEGLERSMREVMVTPKSLEDPATLDLFPEEMYKVIIVRAHAEVLRDEVHLVHYNVPRSLLPYLVRNAAAYIARREAFW